MNMPPPIIEGIPEFKKSFFRRFLWLFIIILFVLIIISIIATIKIRNNGANGINNNPNQSQTIQSDNSITYDFDPDNPPQFIQADFVELDKIYSISKFRSGVGHDYSYLSGETCRSMKHYFQSINPDQPDYKIEKTDTANYPRPTIENGVKIFSPVEGTLTITNGEPPWVDDELQVSPDSYPGIRIRFMHVTYAPGVVGGHVKAGQLIGLVLANQSFDLGIEFNKTGSEKAIGYISYFAAIPDDIFAKYQARGVESRSDLIITKAYRDAHPYTCIKDQFSGNNLATDPAGANTVYLSGYTEATNKIMLKYTKPNVSVTTEKPD
jgi:hypothetical protein